MPMADISNPSQQECSLELQEALNHWLELAKKMQQIAPLPSSIHSFIYEASDTWRKRVDWQRLLEKLAPVSLLLTSLQGSSASFVFFCLFIFWVSWRENSRGWRMSPVDLSLLPAWTFQRDLSRVFCGSPGVTVESLRGRSGPASITTFYMFVGSTQICEGQCSYHPKNGFFVHCSCFSFKNEVFYGASISKLFYVKHIPKMSLKIFHERTRTKMQIKRNRRDVQPNTLEALRMPPPPCGVTLFLIAKVLRSPAVCHCFRMCLFIRSSEVTFVFVLVSFPLL